MFVMKEEKEMYHTCGCTKKKTNKKKHDNSENVCGLISVLLILTKWHRRPVRTEPWLASRSCQLSCMMT